MLSEMVTSSGIPNPGEFADSVCLLLGRVLMLPFWGPSSLKTHFEGDMFSFSTRKVGEKEYPGA